MLEFRQPKDSLTDILKVVIGTNNMKSLIAGAICGTLLVILVVYLML